MTRPRLRVVLCFSFLAATTGCGMEVGDSDPETTAVAAAVDCSGYPETRYFLEAQGWWIPTPGHDTNDFGHLHVGTCFPVEQQVSGVLDFDIRIILHDNPGTLHRISPHIATDGSNPRSGVISNIGKTCPAGQTCQFWFHTQVDTTLSDYDGRQEFRFLTSVKEPDGQELHVSTGWQADLRNGGGRTVRDYRRENFHEARGWYTGADYEVARLEDVFPYDPLTTTWTPRVRARPGSGGIPVTYHSVHVDPAFHANSAGIVLAEGAGAFDDEVTVPVNDLDPGPHKLVVKTNADCKGGNCGSENDGQRLVGLFVVPFEVAGDGPPPPEPSCGDGTCDASEDCNSCAADCGACPEPEPWCGDGVCGADEDCATCPDDCGVCPDPDPQCGDGLCDAGEDCNSCSSDCGVCTGGDELVVQSDTYVRSGSYADNNYGTSTRLRVKDGGSNYDRETYLRFDVSGKSSSSTTLRLEVRRLPNGSPVTIEVCLAPESFTWGESTLTWNGRSTNCTPLASATVSAEGTLDIPLGAVQSLGSDHATLVIRDPDHDNRMVEIHSRETSTPPLLLLND